jgi:hypothetical protein
MRAAVDIAFEFGLDIVSVYGDRWNGAIPIGLCLGLWIKAKTQSALALSIYVLLTVAGTALFLPGSIITQRWADAVGLAVLVLWFAGALIGRHQIARYYAAREGSNFYLSLEFTLLFGVWYLNYRIRPEFPHETQLGPGA